MSFLDNFKSRKKNDEDAVEQQFQRGLREGSWPEGVDDFQLMSNTGSFLPAHPDPDPLAEADAFAQQGRADDARADWSVVRAAGSSRAEGGFRVIEGSAGARPVKPAADAQRRPALDDEGVQVMPRAEARSPRPASAPSAQKSYAERLRERVAAADIPAPKPVAPAPAPQRRPAQAEAPATPKRTEPARTAQVPDAKPAVPADTAKRASEAPSFSSDAVVVRTRTYDDVRRIAEGLVGQRRPVVLAMRGASDATCQRILDFSFGLCCASGAVMSEIGQKLYAICPKGVSVSDATMADLKRQGLLR